MARFQKDNIIVVISNCKTKGYIGKVKEAYHNYSVVQLCGCSVNRTFNNSSLRKAFKDEISLYSKHHPLGKHATIKGHRDNSARYLVLRLSNEKDATSSYYEKSLHTRKPMTLEEAKTHIQEEAQRIRDKEGDEWLEECPLMLVEIKATAEIIPSKVALKDF